MKKTTLVIDFSVSDIDFTEGQIDRIERLVDNIFSSIFDLSKNDGLLPPLKYNINRVDYEQVQSLFHKNK